MKLPETPIGWIRFTDWTNQKDMLELWITEEMEDRDLHIEDFLYRLKVYLNQGKKV